MKLQCPECDRRLRLSDEQRVRTVRCPKCNAIFSVVEPVRDEGVAIKDDPSLPSPGPPRKGSSRTTVIQRACNISIIR